MSCSDLEYLDEGKLSVAGERWQVFESNKSVKKNWQWLRQLNSSFLWTKNFLNIEFGTSAAVDTKAADAIWESNILY